MSASKIPTRAPSAARASAKFEETVDLPTPPFPDATAIILRTPLIGVTPFWTSWATTLVFTDRLIVQDPPTTLSIASRTKASRVACQPAAGYPSVISSETVSPSILEAVIAFDSSRVDFVWGSRMLPTASSSAEVEISVMLFQIRVKILKTVIKNTLFKVPDATTTMHQH